MAARSGQITVATAGTAVAGPDVAGTRFVFTAHPSNTKPVWVGHVNGDVDANNGFPLTPGDALELFATNLNQLWFDADVNGEKVCWIRLK